MLAIDWAHTKDFAIYDGKTAELIPWTEVIKRVKGQDKAVIEHGAPLLYLYRIAKIVPTYTILPNFTAKERTRLGLEKSDLTDVKIIYDLASKNGLGEETALDGIDAWVAIPFSLLKLDDSKLRLIYLYHQFLYSLKAQIATNNLAKCMKRHFGDIENPTLFLLSQHIDEFELRCQNLRKEIEKLAPEPPDKIIKIRGISKWLWCGIIIFADPRLFETKSAYRKWCGLMDRKSINYKFSRNASRIYYLCADSLMTQRTPYWREIYDRTKEELSNREGYTHPHSGAMNRLMTAFANFVFVTVKEEGIAQQEILW